MSENKRVRSLIKTYRVRFKLLQTELAELMEIRQSTYSGMERGSSIVDFDRISKIAKVYGLKVWEFINPDQEFPNVDDLPAKTRKLILARTKGKNAVRDSDLQLPNRIEEVLRSNKLSSVFTPSDIWKLLPTQIKEKIKPIRITDSLNKPSLSKKVEHTGKKRGHEKLYKLI